MNLPMDCDGCSKKFLMPHALSCRKRILVLARNIDAAKEWGGLSDRDLLSLCIYYKPKINSRTVQGESNRDGARIVTGSQGLQGYQYRQSVTG